MRESLSGSVLLLPPPPWRQLLATTLGQTLAVALVLYYRRRLGDARARRAATVNDGTAAGVK